MNENLTKIEKEECNKHSDDQLSLENGDKLELASPNPPSKKALNYALRILAQRDYSVYKMSAKLKSRGFEANEIKETLAKLHSFNYLREEEYTRGRINQLIVEGYANSFITQKLLQEQLFAEESLIDEIRNSQDLGSDSQIIYLIEKKLRGQEIPAEFSLKMKLKDKITRFLLSKGFNFSEISNHLNEKFK